MAAMVYFDHDTAMTYCRDEVIRRTIIEVYVAEGKDNLKKIPEEETAKE